MEHIIQMEGINKYYKMGAESLHALREVNLTVERGEFLAILGPSGSGKSTLMNIVGCMDTADTGSYQLDGAEISAMKDDQLTQVRNEKIGFIFQKYQLIPRYTVLQNICMPVLIRGSSRREAEEQCMETIRLLGLGERVTHKPSELSGGQQQRVAIARAAQHPSGRRAHRGAGFRHRPGGAGAVCGAQRPGEHHCDDYPR